MQAAQDTRPIHSSYFVGLTPEFFEYYAGHYRGEQLWCLDKYEVGVAGDKAVGHVAATVPLEMDDFASRLKIAIELAEYQVKHNTDHDNETIKLINIVSVITALFVEFLEIHPYANGNGHMARFLVLSLLGRQNIYPTNAWSVDPRPADPPYTNLIARYRAGEREPLVRFIIQAL